MNKRVELQILRNQQTIMQALNGLLTRYPLRETGLGIIVMELQKRQGETDAVIKHDA